MMKRPAPLMHLLTVVFMTAVLLGFGRPVAAEDATRQPWMPMPAKATGGQCDADPAWMREWHMKALLHKRDETMHEGIRTKKFELKRCITCHAVKDDKGEFVTVKDKRHFCRTCHDYAAVSIDCFDCHASRPGSGDSNSAELPAGHPPLDKAASAVKPEKGEQTSIALLQKYFGGEGQ